MEIIKVTPRGYCQGVVRAIRTARQTITENPGVPVYMLGMIVHNEFVVREFESLGMICLEDPAKTRLELLDQINSGIVIITAHGAGDEVFRKAREKGLTVVDATCPDVEKTHKLVREHVTHGDVVYIGKKNHPEAEGTISISPRVHLVTCVEDVESLPRLENILITCQTTLSVLETRKLISACMQRFPDASAAPEICSATRVRQEAVMNLKDTDLLIVVGDPRSNNSNQLRRIGTESGIPDCLMIESSADLTEEIIRDKKRIAVTSGSSTPTALTDGVIAVLEHYAATSVFDLSADTHSSIL